MHLILKSQNNHMLVEFLKNTKTNSSQSFHQTLYVPSPKFDFQ